MYIMYIYIHIYANIYVCIYICTSNALRKVIFGVEVLLKMFHERIQAIRTYKRTHSIVREHILW